MALRMPGKNYTSGPVQSMGRQDVGGPLSVANAEAAATIKIGQTIQGVAQIASEISLAEQDTRLNEQMSVSAVELDALSNDVISTNSYNVSDPRLKDTSYEKNDARGQTRQLIGAGEVSVQRYANGVQKILGNAQKRLPEYDFARFEEMFRKEEGLYQGKVLSDSVVKKSTEMREKVTGNAINLVDANKLPEALIAIQASTVHTAKEKGIISNKMSLRSEDNNTVSSLYSSSIGRLEASRARFTDENYTGPYTQKKRKTAINDIDAQIKELTAKAVEQAEHEKQKRASDLEIAIDSGDSRAGRMQVETAFDDRDITGAKRTELVKKLNKVNQKKVDDSLSMTRVNRVMNGDLVFDPTNSQDIKDVNLFTKSADPATTIQVIRKTQILPDHIKQSLGAWAFNGTPEQGAKSLDMYMQLKDVAPVAMNKLSPDTLAMLSGAAVLNEAGIPAEQSITRMRELSEIPENKRRAYVPDSKGNLESLQGLMDADESLFDLGGTWSRDVEPNPSMVADFNAGVSTFYPLVQDMGMAQKMAQKMAYQGIQRSWGITQTGAMLDGEDKRVMKLPPERLLGKSPEYMQEVMTDFEEMSGYSQGSVVIMSDSMTGKNYSYQVMTIDEETGLPTMQAERFYPQKMFPITNDRMRAASLKEAREEFAVNQELDRTNPLLNETRKAKADNKIGGL